MKYSNFKLLMSCRLFMQRWHKKRCRSVPFAQQVRARHMQRTDSAAPGWVVIYQRGRLDRVVAAFRQRTREVDCHVMTNFISRQRRGTEPGGSAAESESRAGSSCQSTGLGAAARRDCLGQSGPVRVVLPSQSLRLAAHSTSRLMTRSCSRWPGQPPLTRSWYRDVVLSCRAVLLVGTPIRSVRPGWAYKSRSGGS